MIYTCTLNPCVDYYLTVEGELMDVEVNRASKEQFRAGGKGLNVSMLLDKLGVTNRAVALLGGFTGSFIESAMSVYERVQLVSIPLQGDNRVNVKMNHDKGILCVNAKGPEADNKTKDSLRRLIDELTADDWFMICGKAARGLDDDFIVEMCTRIHNQGAKLVVDMESMNLDMLKQCKPYMIKPNLYELSKLMGKEVGLEDLESVADELKDSIDLLLVSLGKDGAYLTTGNEVYRMSQEPIKAINAVGAGDAMLGAFVGKVATGSSLSEALAYGGAAGCATASSLDEISLNDIEAFLGKIHVTNLNK